MTRVKEFNLPDLGEGLTEGEILKWLVSVGDTVTLNQPIVEVETAKAAVEIPAKWAGQITQIFRGEGDVVEVGTPIIAIDTDPGAGPLPTAAGESSAAEGTGERTPRPRRLRPADGGSEAAAAGVGGGSGYSGRPGRAGRAGRAGRGRTGAGFADVPVSPAPRCPAQGVGQAAGSQARAGSRCRSRRADRFGPERLDHPG